VVIREAYFRKPAPRVRFGQSRENNIAS